METTNDYFSAVFFSVLVIFGAFFLLNLILAVIIDAYNMIDLKEKKKEEKKMEEEAKRREKKFEAIKTMYRMMRLSQKKREMIESAGLKFRWSFFDVVFESVRVERYEKVLVTTQKASPQRQSEKLKEHFQKKLNTALNTNNPNDNPVQRLQRAGLLRMDVKKMDEDEQEDEIGEQIVDTVPPDNGLLTIQENQNEEEEEEESKFSSIDQKQQKVPEENASGLQLLLKNLTVHEEQHPSLQKVQEPMSGLIKKKTNFLDPFGASSLKSKQSTFKEGSNWRTDQEMKIQILEPSMQSRLSSSINEERSQYSSRKSVFVPKKSSLNNLQRSNSPKRFSQSQRHISSLDDEQQDSRTTHVQLVTKKSCIRRCSQYWQQNYLVAKIKGLCLTVAESWQFTVLMNVLIIANTVVMALDRHPISPQEANFIDNMNFAFYILFVAELLIKLIGLGIKRYFLDGFNIYDALIILVSTVDIVSNLILFQQSSSVLSVMRGIRILRILKIAKSQQNIQDFQQTIAKTLVDLRNFSVLLFLVIFTYTLLGMEFFASKLKYNKKDEIDVENGISPRHNFDGFLSAFTTVFIILQGEGYYYIMYNVARSVSQFGILYFVSLVVCGQIILLKLFLAVLLENFEDKRKQNKEHDKGQQRISLNKLALEKLKSAKQALFRKCGCEKKQKKYSEQQVDTSFRRTLTREILEVDRALFFLHIENKFRIKLITLTKMRSFEFALLFFIVVSSILMALENPLKDPMEGLNRYLYYCDAGIVSIFLLEVIIKVMASGFLFNGPNSYLRSTWNILDFTIVAFSLFGLANTSNKNLAILKVIRLVRVLRPLRVIGRYEGLKLAVQTLFMAIPQILNVLLVSLIIFLIYGIFCVSFLKGRYSYCHYAQISEFLVDPTRIVTKFDCLDQGGEWLNRVLNFDNSLNAMELLYAMSMVSWSARMLDATDATYIDYQPVKDSNLYWTLYFLVFTIVFIFFLLNIFVGVVVGTFNTEKERLGKNFLLTETQKEWLELKMMLLNTKPVIKRMLKTSNICRRALFRVANHHAFEYFIFLCIILNTLVLTIHWYEMPENVEEAVRILNFIFAFIFTIEAIIKILGNGRQYIRDNWNLFDFLIVLATLTGILIDWNTELEVGGKATIPRAFRVARLFRIIKRAKVLKIIVDTLIVTLPSLMNVGGLLLLIIYIYSILGMQILSGIQLGEYLNDRANFQTFTKSFLTLIRFSTGEGWDYILEDLAKPYSIVNQCYEEFSYSLYAQTGVAHQCGSSIARLYLATFSLIATVIFLNLFVAIVLESFQEMNKKENKLLSDENMDHLRNCWAEFDPEGTFFIKIADLIPFLTELGEPLGFNQLEKSRQKDQDQFLRHLELPTYNKIQHYYYYDVVQILTQYAYMKIEADRKLKQELMKESFNFEKLTVEILNSIKGELEFRSQNFRLKEISAFKEAMEKERKLYSKMGAVKDDLDSQHFWAGGRIKQMYGKTGMNFTGVGAILNKKFSKEASQQISESGSELAQKKKKSIQITQLDQERFENINQQEQRESGGHPSPQNLNYTKKKSIWKTLNSVINIDEEDTNLDYQKNKPPIKNKASGMSVVSSKRSSIMLPMIRAPTFNAQNAKIAAHQNFINQINEIHEERKDIDLSISSSEEFSSISQTLNATQAHESLQKEIKSKKSRASNPRRDRLSGPIQIDSHKTLLNPSMGISKNAKVQISGPLNYKDTSPRSTLNPPNQLHKGEMLRHIHMNTQGVRRIQSDNQKLDSQNEDKESKQQSSSPLKKYQLQMQESIQISHKTSIDLIEKASSEVKQRIDIKEEYKYDNHWLQEIDEMINEVNENEETMRDHSDTVSSNRKLLFNNESFGNISLRSSKKKARQGEAKDKLQTIISRNQGGEMKDEELVNSELNKFLAKSDSGSEVESAIRTSMHLSLFGKD